MQNGDGAQVSKLAENLFGDEFQLQPVGVTLRELATHYNRAVGSGDSQLASRAHEAVGALIASESSMLNAMMLGYYVKHAANNHG